MKKLGLILTLVGAILGAPIAQATVILYAATLNGASEAPPNASPGTGFATVRYDNVLHTMQVEANFTGLLGNVTAAHIHCCTLTPFTATAGVATTTPTFTGFPSGVTSGTYSHLFDMTLASSWNPAFITAHGGTTAQAEADFFAGVAAGQTYFNIHTTVVPGGEIRGFLVVPEPASLALLGLGLLGIGFSRRKRAG